MTDSYNLGLNDEYSLIQRLKKKHKITTSTTEENKYKDIDCFVDGVACSIKTQHSAQRTGNFVFELEFRWRITQEWQQSWWYAGTAVFYLVQVGNTVYKINKDEMITWVDKHGWDRETQNTAAAYEEQANLCHPHDTSKIGLVNIKKLVAAGVAVVMDYPPLQQRKSRKTNL